ncbi:unnamed protein product [Prunus brigantina]
MPNGIGKCMAKPHGFPFQARASITSSQCFTKLPALLCRSLVPAPQSFHRLPALLLRSLVPASQFFHKLLALLLCSLVPAPLSLANLLSTNPRHQLMSSKLVHPVTPSLRGGVNATFLS